jgi:hypothetical protein
MGPYVCVIGMLGATIDSRHERRRWGLASAEGTRRDVNADA